MKTLLTILLTLLLASLMAQRATTQQPKYYSAYQLAERLPGGQLVTVHQSGKNKFLSYPTLTVTTERGDTLWSITEDIGNGGRVLNIVPLSDSSFVVHGGFHECDISYGNVMVYHTRTGERLFETDALNPFERYVGRTAAGVQLSGGNFLLLDVSSSAVYPADFSTIARTSLEEDWALCGKTFRSAVPGINNNVLAIHYSNWPPAECPPELREIRLVSIDSNRVNIEVSSITPYLPGRALNIFKEDTFTYLLSDQRLVKTDQNFQHLAHQELTSNATEGMMHFSNGVLFVLHFANNQYEITRYSSADLEPIDTISLDYVPGLIYNDFYVKGDSIYAYGELSGYADEAFYGTYTDASAVSTVTAIGESVTLPNIDLTLSNLSGGEITVQSINSTCGTACRNGLYSVSYSGTTVRLINNGMVPITELYLHTQTRAECDCFSLCGLSEFWRKRFTGLSLGPGEEITLALDDIYIGDRLGEYQLCLWAANVNGELDVDHSNNVVCYDVVNSTFLDPPAPMFDLFPDRDLNVLSLRSANSEKFIVEVFDVNGRFVGTAAGRGEADVPMVKPRGVYFVVATEDNGRSHVHKLVW